MATTSVNPFSNSATLRALRGKINQLILRILQPVLAKTAKTQRVIEMAKTSLICFSNSATLRALRALRALREHK